jgi:hypothetical protein
VVKQFGVAVVLDVLADRMPGDFLHGPVLQLGAPTQRFGLIVASLEVIAMHPAVSPVSWKAG